MMPHVETVVILSRQKVDEHIHLEVNVALVGNSL